MKVLLTFCLLFSWNLVGSEARPAPTVLSEKVPLTLTGFGVRKKKVVLVKVSVYDAAHYVSQPQDWNPKDLPTSLKKQNRKLMTMKFLRDVSGDKIKGAFEDSLRENGIDVARPDVAAILLKVSATDLKEGNEVTFLGIRGGSTQKLIVTGPGGKVESEGTSTVDDFWQMWFGKPADGGLEDLKESLGKLPEGK